MTDAIRPAKENSIPPEDRSGLRIDDAKWYTHSSHCIGIVLVNTGHGHKAYIGIGYGNDEGFDARYIAGSGARFRDGDALWPHIERWAE